MDIFEREQVSRWIVLLGLVFCEILGKKVEILEIH